MSSAYVYGVRSSAIGSRLISWGVRSKCSHVVVGLPSKGYFHSHVSGVGPLSSEDFTRSYTTIRSVEIPLPGTDARVAAFEERFIRRTKNATYDYPAFAYFALRAVLHRAVGTPMPDRNAWDSGGLLCTEFAELFVQAFEETFGSKLLEPAKVDRLLTPDEFLDALARCVPLGCVR